MIVATQVVAVAILVAVIATVVVVPVATVFNSVTVKIQVIYGTSVFKCFS